MHSRAVGDEPLDGLAGGISSAANLNGLELDAANSMRDPASDRRNVRSAGNELYGLINREKLLCE